MAGGDGRVRIQERQVADREGTMDLRCGGSPEARCRRCLLREDLRLAMNEIYDTPNYNSSPFTIGFRDRFWKKRRALQDSVICTRTTCWTTCWM